MKKLLSVLSSTLQGGLRGGLLILALLATSSLWASYSFQSGNLYYYIKNANEVTVTAANDTRSITIPRTVTYDSITYIVTRIGDVAFYACSSLTSISIPNSITSIGEGAFYRCSSLASINIPNGVTSIGYATFYECSSLTSINIPNSVTSIGEWAFSHCSALTSINIPNGVTSIGRNAFSHCSALTSINIPNGVTSIEHETFWECSSLSSASIGNSVTSIGENAFWSCSSLTSVNIPNGVTSIKGCAFYRCSALTSITIPNSVTSIEDGAFAHCSALTSIHIPDSVTSIGELTFSSCSSLTLVSIPESVTSIGDKAFEGCSSLTSITIPNSVTSIGEWAFSSCSSLTSVSIGNSVTSIGEYAFYSCSKLTSVTIGESVTSIGDYAFEYCTSLTKTNYTGDIAGWCNIMFGNRYANPMFYSHNFYINDQEIKDLVIPNSVTSIGNYAFFSCSSLTSINIPNSITSIGEGTFYGCSSLTSISIPNSVTSIGEYAFNGCSALTSITIPNSVTSIRNYTFKNCSALTSITIPNSVTSIGERAFEYCSSLTSATIGNSVTSIGAEAFYCVNLEEIYCYPTTPPAVTSEPTFLHYNATLYVPCDSKEAYEEHPVFGKFKNIKGIDDCGGGFVTTHIHETICQGEVYEFGEYLCDTTGTYTAIIGDVTTFLYLTVLPSSIDTITVEACDSYEWRGQVYTISGDYTFHGDKEDSIERCHTEILHLTISKSKYKEETIVSEGSYEWNGKVLTESGDYVSTLKTVNGCDSILELHLKIVPTERENNIIYYTSNSGEVITPYATDVFGANILSNTYENGLGIITFDGPVTQIGHSAFYKTHITSIVLPNTVTSIGHTAFCYCYYLTSIVIPNTVTRIGWSAFSYCYDLTSINIPSSVTFIDEYAFEYCESLTSIEIPEGVKSIKQYTFFGCDRLESVVIPNSVQSIGDYAFFWCSSLNSINLPNKLRTIGEYAFRNCPFTSITIPKSVTKIKDRAFNVCKELVSIVVEDGNTTYDSRNNCNAIIETGTNTLITGCATTTIPDDIVSIADGAFYGCNSLGSITIPNSVTKIGNEAFRCSIDTIYCYAITPPELYDEKVFDEYDANLNVPCSSLEAYKSDSLWGKFTNIQCFETTPPSEPQDTTIYHPTEYATICEGEMYTWMGVDFTAAGMFISEEIVEDENYIYHYIYTLELQVLPSSIDTIVVEAYDSYEWHGVVYTKSGTYRYEEHCYQEILQLTIIDTPTPPEPQDTTIYIYHPTEYGAICEGGEYYWRGVMITVAGTYTYNEIVEEENYTYLHTYTLELLPLLPDEMIELPTTEVTICENELPYVWNINWDTWEITEAGNYMYHEFLDCGEAIAIYNLNLTVLPSDTIVFIEEAYDSYEWHGKVYTESGVYTYRDPYNPCVIEELQLTIIDTPTPPEPEIPTEGIGVFSVGEGKAVTFSRGNLQYTQSTNTWSFAENQWDMIGTDNVTGDSVSFDPTYGDEKYGNALADKIDLFGWSTSTTNFGVSTSTDDNDYSGIFVNWGTNQIGADAPNTWRTLTHGEWEYLLFARPNADALCGVAQVNGVNGLVFLPDTWTCPEGISFRPSSGSNYGVDYYAAYQTFTADQWSKLEASGAVFLPATGGRDGSDVDGVQSRGYYWSATGYDFDGFVVHAECLYFGSDGAHMSLRSRYYGRSVRLVKDVNTTIFLPTLVAIICEGDIFTWDVNGQSYYQAGTYTYEEIVEDENYIYHYIHTLELQVRPSSIDTIVVEAYDSYEWHGEVYTESGTYIYEEHCYQEILQLTIIPSEDKEYVYEHHNYLVCDADIFVDPITGSTHVISSLIPFSLTWSDTIIGTNIDTIHTFNITPIVSSEPLTEDMLYAIGAVPKLVAGEKVDLMGTTELIMAYYQTHDQHDIADVIGVEWVAGHDVVLDAEQTTHTMVLEVWDECDDIIPMEFTFPVSKKDSEPQDTTIYIYYTEDVTICEGETLTWRGMEYTETGTYTYAYEEIVEEDDYIYHYHHIYTLDLTVIAPMILVWPVEAYDSYEWHGVVYTESGTYLYEEWCFQEILELTIIPSTETAVDNMQTDSDHSAQKILRDQQILILRDDKTYTILGAEVK